MVGMRKTQRKKSEEECEPFSIQCKINFRIIEKSLMTRDEERSTMSSPCTQGSDEKCCLNGTHLYGRMSSQNDNLMMLIILYVHFFLAWPALLVIANVWLTVTVESKDERAVIHSAAWRIESNIVIISWHATRLLRSVEMLTFDGLMWCSDVHILPNTFVCSHR